jgi:virginiamycin B lyase
LTIASTVLLTGVLIVVIVSGRGASAPALSLASGTAWFYSPTAGAVVAIDGSTGKTFAQVPVNTHDPMDVVQSGSSAVLVDPSDATARRVDAATRQVSTPRPLEPGSDPNLRVVTNGTTTWGLVQQGTAVEQLDERQLSPLAPTASMGGSVSSAETASDGRLWATTADGHVRSFADGTVETTTQIPGAQRASLVLAGDQPVVVEPDQRTAVALDARGLPGRPLCDDVGADQEPTFAGAVDRPWLLTTAGRTGSLEVTDLERATCQSIVLGATTDGYGTAVEADGLVYVPDRHLGQVVVIDPTAPGDRVKARVDLGLPDADVRLFVHDGHVWFDQNNGDNAGVINGFHAAIVSKSAPPAGPTGPPPAATSRTEPAPDPTAGTGSSAGPSSNGSTAGASAARQNGDPGAPPGTLPAPLTPATAIIDTVPPPTHTTESTGTTTTKVDAVEPRWSATPNPDTTTEVEFSDVSTGPHRVASWSFDGGDTPRWPPDNNPNAPPASPPPVKFAAAGDHQVTLTISKPDGSTVADSHVLHVSSPAAKILRVDAFSLKAHFDDDKPLGVISAGGKLWVNPFEQSSLLGVTTSGVVTPLQFGGVGGNAVTIGPDGNIWVFLGNVPRVEKVNPSTGAGIAGYNLPSDIFAEGHTIVGAPDGDIWVVDQGELVRMKTDGTVDSETAVPSGAEGPLVAGVDGHVWFVDSSKGQVGEYLSPTTVTRFDTPGHDPCCLTAGPDGAMWFSDAGRIVRMTPGGGQQPFPLPNGHNPGDLTTGSDGNLWFTESDASKIGMITPAGVITEYDLLTPLGDRGAIVAGPDGNLWITEYSADKIARATL